MSDALNQLDLRDPGSDEFFIKSVDAAREVHEARILR